jgi:phospholipase C
MEGDEFADRTSLSRRGVLGGGLALGLGGLLQACGGSATISRATAVRPAGNDLDAIEHVVFLMMENRSFDHYFGTYPDAKGFDDHPSGSLGPFSQAWAIAPAGPVPAGQLLPYRLDPATVSAQCAGDNSKPDHGWISQHESWNMGAMDRFVAAHSELAFDGPDQGPLVMAYMTQADVPFLWALAKAYTLCDAFYGSVLGPTMPNRLYYLSGMLPPRRQERRADRLHPHPSAGPGRRRELRLVHRARGPVREEHQLEGVPARGHVGGAAGEDQPVPWLQRSALLQPVPQGRD